MTAMSRKSPGTTRSSARVRSLEKAPFFPLGPGASESSAKSGPSRSPFASVSAAMMSREFMVPISLEEIRFDGSGNMTLNVKRAWGFRRVAVSGLGGRARRAETSSLSVASGLKIANEDERFFLVTQNQHINLPRVYLMFVWDWKFILFKQVYAMKAIDFDESSK